MEISSLSRNEAYSYLREGEINQNEPVNLLFKVSKEKGMFAVIDSFLPQICQVIGINKKGLIFRYYDENDKRPESERLDILVKGQGFCLENIEFDVKSVSTLEYKKNLILKECHIKFKNISKNMTTTIEFFINSLINENNQKLPVQ